MSLIYKSVISGGISTGVPGVQVTRSLRAIEKPANTMTPSLVC